MLKQKEKKFSTISTIEKVGHIADWIEDKKGQDLVALNLEGVNSFTDAMIIVSATSLRHAQALSDFVMQQCKKENFEYLRVEGHQAGQWILLDLNDVVVNIFQRDTRDTFNLESLWADAEVIRKSQTQE